MEPVGAIRTTGLPILTPVTAQATPPHPTRTPLELPLIRERVSREATEGSGRFPIPCPIILHIVNLWLIVSMHASFGFPADVAALAVEFLMCPFVVCFQQLSPSSLGS